MTKVQQLDAARELTPPTFDLRRQALFLDIDGTLAELQDDPSAVRLSPQTHELLRQLTARASGAVAIISGRRLLDADDVVGDSVTSVAGLHGLEYRLDNARFLAKPSATLSRAVGVVRSLARAGEIDVRIEDKGAGVAIHYRHAPQQESRIRYITEAIAHLHGIRALHGNMVSELLPHGSTKGDAVRFFMAHAPFADRVPVAVGDDLTDEDAFAACSALGGSGVIVGPRPDTRAQYRLQNVAQVEAWLKAALTENRS
jgi:trehalose 6-phosphate phosphatase